MTAATRRQPDLTRQKLLECAFEEMHASGFRSASLDTILQSAGVTKGALYHHFASKADLGYAVVDEVIRPWIEENWKPAAQSDNPVDAAIALCRSLTQLRSDKALTCGCPFNNLINEMSPVDEGFRTRLHQILAEWRSGIAQSLAAAQARGLVRREVEPEAAAAFVISAIEGCIGLAKADQSREFLEAGMRGLIDYLEQLRAR
ncbi:MAG TPA: TetR/AcrR family transcriptional regulator [Nevskiaceae bacterium]|nr:TetR/AcrR family transcriptional regulator [Nevskiaceae bacterium]